MPHLPSLCCSPAAIEWRLLSFQMGRVGWGGSLSGGKEIWRLVLKLYAGQNEIFLRLCVYNNAAKFLQGMLYTIIEEVFIEYTSFVLEIMMGDPISVNYLNCFLNSFFSSKLFLFCYWINLPKAQLQYYYYSKTFPGSHCLLNKPQSVNGLCGPSKYRFHSFFFWLCIL